MTFRDLPRGAVFRFITPELSVSPRGPWVKVSARQYVPQEGDGTGEPQVITVGTINVEVERIAQ